MSFCQSVKVRPRGLKDGGDLENTFLSIGGETTRAALSAHCRLSIARLFTAPDDSSILHIVKDDDLEALTLRVAETKIIDPSDGGSIDIQKERCLLTLSACHPFPRNYQQLHPMYH